MTNSSVPEVFIAYLAVAKLENKSNYQIDDIDVREFTGECWKLLSPEERSHYREQLENPEKPFSAPSISKLASDLNRGLQSAYDETSKNKSYIDDELAAQVSNFKYVNLSNSDLHKDQNLGLFANKPFQSRDAFKNNPLLALSMETSLSTFPSIEHLGHNSEDKDKFIDSTAAILEGVVNNKNGSILKNGSLYATLTASVAAYVDKNFHNIKDLPKERQIEIGEIFKKEYKKLYDEQQLINKKNKKPKGYPVEISSTKFSEAFEKVDMAHLSPQVAPPSPSSVVEFLRNKSSSQDFTTTKIPNLSIEKPPINRTATRSH